MSDSTITYEDDAVTIGRRLARMMDVSPFLLWTGAEARDFEGGFETLAPCLAASPRARRLQVAFAMAAEAGMPESTRLCVLAEWSALLLRRLPEDPGRALLAQVVEFAQLAAATPPKVSTADLDAMLTHNTDADAHAGSALEYAAAMLRGALQWFVDARQRDAHPTPFDAWYMAADVLGAISDALEPEQAEQAFVECTRILATVYRWTPTQAESGQP